MKIAIVGSRSFNDYNMFKNHIEKYKNLISEIISGGAKGTDNLAERYAKENKIPITIFYPDWNKFGKSAGPIRNKEIINNSDMVIAFWDGLSKGTENSINLAKKYKKLLYIIKFNKK